VEEACSGSTLAYNATVSLTAVKRFKMSALRLNNNDFVITEKLSWVHSMNKKEHYLRMQGWGRGRAGQGWGRGSV
jgi:hypothetical protein